MAAQAQKTNNIYNHMYNVSQFTYESVPTASKIFGGQFSSINQFSGHAYPWRVAGAAARVGSSKHLDPLQQSIDALQECQGETN